MDVTAEIARLKREIEDYRVGRKYDRDPKRFPPAPIDMLSNACLLIERAVGMRFGRVCWSHADGLYLLRAVELAARSGDAESIAAALRKLDDYRDRGAALPDRDAVSAAATALFKKEPA